MLSCCLLENKTLNHFLWEKKKKKISMVHGLQKTWTKNRSDFVLAKL